MELQQDTQCKININSSGYIFGLINCFVHMFMYYYYYLTALGKKPRWAMLLTIGQVNILLNERLHKWLLESLLMEFGPTNI
jgi:hypothetical protein